MARKFRCRSDMAYVMLAGLGKVSGGRVIEGDQYARLCPQLLEEVKSTDSGFSRETSEIPRVVSVLVSAPVPLATGPSPVFVPPLSVPVVVAPSVVEVVSSAEPISELELDAQVEEPSMIWTKAQLTEYAEVLGIYVEPGMTKGQILAAIKEAEA